MKRPDRDEHRVHQAQFAEEEDGIKEEGVLRQAVSLNAGVDGFRGEFTSDGAGGLTIDYGRTLCGSSH
ncbi:hypothetical protein [Donghicola mangrovi]|uniref:Uncharacterized protein n=1 Tax=Donghicola mangrovi TaxID=2729614 RepID=A0A850Q144_9RHOB|nr:hypothetical protein [Donghicola mangrovi]NVO23297.1 hypothetical protein [Donghicola mangrovi]